MFDILVVICCWYFAFQNIKMLAEMPLSQWQPVQYLLVLVTIGLIGVGGMRAWQYYQRTKKEKEARLNNPDGDAEQEKDDSESKGNDLDSDDLSYLDELDDLDIEKEDEHEDKVAHPDKEKDKEE